MSASNAVSERLRTRVEVAGLPTQLRVRGEPILASSALPQFYAQRLFRPAWTDDRGLTASAEELLQILAAAENEGLNPLDYHTGAIEDLKHRDSADPGRLVDLELVLTDAFLLYASHLVGGRVDPTSFDVEWHVPPSRRGDVLSTLDDALRRNDIRGALYELRPRQPGYRDLLGALARYREIAARSGWDAIPYGGKLEQGMEDERVVPLRTRLRESGDLNVAGSSMTFDEHLRAAVVHFQRRHGLEPDGVVGPATLAAINVPAQDRVRQIELSLERWRWLPEDLGRRYILVNIPSFELEVVYNGEIVMDMRVVVGKPYRQTPVFSAEMTYLVLSPYWHVPPSIAVQDILSELKKDAGYLAKKNMKVFQGWGSDAQPIDPEAVDWSGLGESAFPYRFRQEPGPFNALGAVKFMFPNPHNVYLHDTPSRELFQRPDRSFSSGCIRVEKPLELAEYLLSDGDRWTRQSILTAVEKGVEQTARLPAPIAVHLQYWTSWVDREGLVHFRKDIYGRDERLAKALDERRASR